MSHALLVSDNQTLNNLYAVNLNAYVATNVTIKTKYTEAKQAIKSNPNFDVVICLDNKKFRQDLSEIFSCIKEMDNQVPVILVGTKSEVIESNFMAIPNQYALKEIVRAVAKILKITAKDMAAKEVPKFFPIPVPFILDQTETNSDIYYRTEVAPYEYEYFKIIEKGQSIDESVKMFKEEGTDFLFVVSEERLSFVNATSTFILGELSNKSISVEDKVKVLGHGFDLIGEQLFESPKATEQVQELSNACIASISSIVSEIPKLSTLLNILLTSKGEYVYMHSILGAYVAGHIIDNMDWGSKEQKDKVSFVFFFHDIFLVPIFKKYPHLTSEDDLLFSDELSEKEKNIVIDHAKMAGELVRSFKQIPIGSDMIITQHHGVNSGTGFAMQFRDDLSPLSKVLMISEEMAQNIFKLKKSGKLFLEYKDKLIQEISEKFRNHTYQKMIKTLETLES